MQVILLERVAKLGQMGEVVRVKEGFARNYLLPQGKAMRANDANIAAFEAKKADLAARNDETRADAEKIAADVSAQVSGTRIPVAKSAAREDDELPLRGNR